jgi:hypothetical protein
MRHFHKDKKRTYVDKFVERKLPRKIEKPLKYNTLKHILDLVHVLSGEC